MSASSRFITYIFFAGLMQAKIILLHGDCWYDNRKHEENSEVLTGEPCLNCTCSRSALLCYLRVCPKLPNPPPSGCILLHRFKTCCPELICSDFQDGGNGLEARADSEVNLDIPSNENSIYDNACISNGSIYGSGSAMHSSSMCEYCYCLSGKQVCVKPKCLLSIEGCHPIYEKTSCCPVRYNCTPTFILKPARAQPSTTTIGYAVTSNIQSGCLVENSYHPEGSKVVGIGHSICDNCYCLRGLLRCEPLSCAPPLLGCTPLVKPGECCAASYNCNGTLEVEPEPNYGLFPIISKEYSKLRKEVHRKPAGNKMYTNKDGVVTVEPLYVLAENISEPTTKFVIQRSPETFGTTRQFFGANFKPSSTDKPPYEDKFFLISSSKHRSSTENNIPAVLSTTVRSRTNVSTQEKIRSSTVSPSKTEDSAYFGNFNIFSIVDSLLDGKSYRRVDTISAEDRKNSLSDEITEDSISASTESLTTVGTTVVPDISTDAQTEEPLISTTEEIDVLVTVTAILNSTDCNNGIDIHLDNGAHIQTNEQPVDPIEINNMAEGRTELLPTTDFQTEDYLYFSSSEVLSTEEVRYANVQSRNKVKSNHSKLPPDIEAILNITKQKIGEDFDYDYKEPTLPPSLPNLKIIPFLATDALDVIKDSPKDRTALIEEKIDDVELEQNSNMFRPPIKTEGGFIPKAPIADTFYNNVFVMPPVEGLRPSVNTKVNNCISRGQEIEHGMEIPLDLSCVTCTCFFGNIACQKLICPPPGPGCTKAEEPTAPLCCSNYICNEEKISLLSISKFPEEAVTEAEETVELNPFKDVIKTEPAPDLQSLISDRPSLPTVNTTRQPAFEESLITLNPKLPTTTVHTQDDSAFDELLKFIFSGTPDVIEKPISHNPSLDKNKTSVIQIKSTSANGNGAEVQFIKPINNNVVDASFVEGNRTEIVHISDNMTKKSAEVPSKHVEEKLQPKIKSNPKEIEANRLKQNKKNLVGVGLLKLAGCNIYGRMYRVGRIISELSGPCLECKCTEVGVQCSELRCTNNDKIKN